MIEWQASRVHASPRARKMAEILDIPLALIQGSGPSGRIIEEDVLYYRRENEIAYKTRQQKQQIHSRNESVNAAPSLRATPLAKAIAEVENIDLNQLKGSGCKGKIISSDVLKLVAETNRKNAEPNLQSIPHKTPMSGMRRIIAERMVYSTQTAPHVTITVKAEVTKTVEYRNQSMQEGRKFSYTDLLVKIAALSLRNHPQINVSLEQGEIVHHQDCHIGVAVALEDGLIVPVIHHADQQPLAEITAVLQDKVNRAKQGKLMPADLQKGRFTISNLGMYEVDAFTPIINPPESAILGVGRIIEDLIVRNGQIRIGKTMVLSLSFDHRVIDGAPAALFLKNIKDLLENPQLLRIPS